MFLHTNPRKIFNLQSTYTFSAKYENFLSLALSQAMCSGYILGKTTFETSCTIRGVIESGEKVNDHYG